MISHHATSGSIVSKRGTSIDHFTDSVAVDGV